MGNAGIRQAFDGAVAYLTAHPGEASYRDSVARAVLGDGLRVDVSGPDGESVATDMTRSIGGTGSAPSPGWLLRAATASCVATLIALRAAALDTEVELVEVSVDSASDDRGILGIDPAIPAGPLGVQIACRVRLTGADVSTTRAIVDWAVDHCPVVDALRRAIPVELSLEG